MTYWVCAKSKPENCNVRVTVHRPDQTLQIMKRSHSHPAFPFKSKIRRTKDVNEILNLFR